MGPIKILKYIILIYIHIYIYTLHPLYIPRVAETSGIVAEAAETDKDDRHDARVTSAGGVFYPLVESLCLWSPDSLETLKSISSKVCAVLAVPFWKALT